MALFADLETTQDIFIAASAAPGAQIAVYFTTYTQPGWVDLITRVIHPNPGDPECSGPDSSSFYVSNGDDPATLLASGDQHELDDRRHADVRRTRRSRA